MELNKIYNEDCSVQKSNCKVKILDSVKMFASENSVESINDDLYDAGYVQACNDILEKIRKNDNGGQQMTNTLEIKLLSDNATKPKRNNLDAGYDIYAAETVILEPQQKALVATDLAVNIPKGYVGLLTSRSGVSSKTHLVVETGKIDAGFQGHMKINVKNDWQYDMQIDAEALYYHDIQGDIHFDYKNRYYPMSYKIQKGDRLAQLVIVPIFTPELETVKEFSNETARGQNGFGSSGTR